MARKSMLYRVTMLATILLLAGCASPNGTYSNQYGPRNGDAMLVDPHTGVALPGQSDPGGD
jgi:hypothetical protein